MFQTAPPKTDIYGIANRLWETADELRANSHLKAAEYSIPVLGLIFLKFADSRFTQMEAEFAGKTTGRREIGKANYQAKGVLYLPDRSRFANLLDLKEGDNLGKAINDAMAAIEENNPALKGILPRSYQSLSGLARKFAHVSRGGVRRRGRRLGRRSWRGAGGGLGG
jgi:type I restriction enzyme M protein